MKYLFLLLLCLASTAQAQTPIKIHLIHVSGEGAMTPGQLNETSAVAMDYLRRAGVAPQIYKVSFINDQKPALNNIASQHRRLEYWALRSYRKNWNRRVDVVHFVFPPMSDNGLRYYGGRAITVCGKGLSATSMSNGGVGSYGYQPKKSSLSMAHEIAHILGAGHTDNVDLMNTGALAFVNDVWPLPIAPQTIEEIVKCQSRRKARRKAARKAASF